MGRTVDATAAALWEEALAALPDGERPEWVPEEEWARARAVASEVTGGWAGGHLGFLEDRAFHEAARRHSAPS
jgi:hypothetical protein